MNVKSSSFTDEKIVEVIQQGTAHECDQVLEYLYLNNFPKIQSYILKNSGKEEECKDLFQEALITFYNQVKNNKFKGSSKISTYLFGIARNFWMNELRKRKVTYVSVHENHSVDEETVSEMMMVKEHISVFSKLFSLLKPGCNEILTLFYFDQLKVAAIQKKLSLGSEQVVRNKKMRCMQKLIEIFKKHNITKDFFSF